jgi:RNA polymerase sigma-70 factor (ECF subfamily)
MLRLVASSEGERRWTDTELVEGLQAGQAWAARAVWDLQSDKVHRFLSRALGDNTEAVEDLTQEVFLRIFSRAHVIRDPAALRSFVMSVAIRVLKWELRHRWVRRRVRLSERGDLPDRADEGTSDPEARHALRRCYRILDGLGARERTAFVLRFVEGMNMEEVAASMGVSLSTAKRLVVRASGVVTAQVDDDADLSAFFANGSRGEP